MVTVIIVFVALCVLYGIASTCYSKTDNVYIAEAGAVDRASQSAVRVKSAPAKIVRLAGGKRVRTSDFIRITIDGDCMTPRNILKNEEWLVEPIKSSSDIKSKITPRDVLLIYLPDKDIYKIREFVKFDTDDNLETIYYDNGRVKQSSKPHSKDTIRGVLRYAI